MGTDADIHAHVWARTQTYMHERTRMGTDADVHARTRTDADVLWDLSERTHTHVNERTQGHARRTYGREKNTRYAAGRREKNTQYAAG